MASCEYAIASIKLKYYVVVYTPKVVPFNDVVHEYQPPSVIVPRETQTAFNLTSALFPTVTIYFASRSDSTSMLINSVVFM